MFAFSSVRPEKLPQFLVATLRTHNLRGNQFIAFLLKLALMKPVFRKTLFSWVSVILFFTKIFFVICICQQEMSLTVGADFPATTSTHGEIMKKPFYTCRRRFQQRQSVLVKGRAAASNVERSQTGGEKTLSASDEQILVSIHQEASSRIKGNMIGTACENVVQVSPHGPATNADPRRSDAAEEILLCKFC